MAGERIQISGLLRSELHWGPPNFGEEPSTDSRFVAWVVQLDKPVPVRGKVNVSGKNVANILEFGISVDLGSSARDELRVLDGQMALITGKLWAATTQGDVRPGVINATSVERSVGYRCKFE